ncbi:replication-relaxation family protein [Streptomyces sp. NPDC052043]|uniref:replication-relaxation family protein n=1 Tax=Streptomyces sp. NPDC052043 TaxID=3365684 RepID=UPI0037D1F7D8
MDWIPEVHHPIGSGEAVIPDALMYYRRSPVDGDNGSMLRAFVEVDRATMGPERLAAKLPAYERLHRYVPAVPGRRPTLQEPAVEEWRRRYPLFLRVLFVLDGTGPTSRTGSAPCARPPGCWHPSCKTSPSSRRRWPTCSTTAPPHPYGAPSTTPTSASAGPGPGSGRHDARPPQRGVGRVLTSHGRGWAPNGRTCGRPHGQGGSARRRKVRSSTRRFAGSQAPPGPPSPAVPSAQVKTAG